MFVNTAAISLVIGPVAVIDVAVNVNKATLSVSSILTPFARVLSTIAPGLLAESVAETALPLAGVDGARLERVGRALLARLVCIVDALRDGLTGLLLGEILAAA